MEHFRTSRGRRLAPMQVGLIAAATLTLVSLAAPRADEALPAPEQTIGQQMPEFRLRDTNGKTRTLEQYAEKKAMVVVFIGTRCPIANGYAAPLSELAESYRRRGVQFLAVNANPGELKGAHQHARAYRYSFPVLKDDRQVLARGLAARITPEAFVLDEQRIVRYRGRIDNAYASRTEKRNFVTTKDLQSALDAVLAGREVKNPVTRPFGCTIVYNQPKTRQQEREAAVTYYRDVLPILQERCQSCHRPDQVAPFSLLSYEDAKSWAGEIKQFVKGRLMPPWQAEPGHGDFMDVRRMTQKEIDTVCAWVDDGAPAGRKKDAPPAKKWEDGWTLGKPDLVLTMEEAYQVGATGEDDFRCFVLPTGLTEDKQVVAMEVRAGNPRVLHHILAFTDTQGRGRALDAKDPAPGYNAGPGGIGFFPSGGLGGWAPGNMPRFMPEGVARPLPKGSDLVIQAHYHKTGKPEKDKTSIGLYFAKEPVKYTAMIWPLTRLDINIPPGVERHEVKASMKTPMAIKAFSITPHMHLLGKEMKVTATLPDGTVKDLVWVKNWDYRWQDTYRYKEMVELPAGTLLEMRAYFDNSANNPRNPSNPPQTVRFGEQTTDEMAFAFIDFITESSGGGLLQLLLGGRR